MMEHFLFTNEFILTAETIDGEILTVKNSALVYETEKPTVTVVLKGISKNPFD